MSGQADSTELSWLATLHATTTMTYLTIAFLFFAKQLLSASFRSWQINHDVELL